MQHILLSGSLAGVPQEAAKTALPRSLTICSVHIMQGALWLLRDIHERQGFCICSPWAGRDRSYRAGCACSVQSMHCCLVQARNTLAHHQPVYTVEGKPLVISASSNAA